MPRIDYKPLCGAIQQRDRKRIKQLAQSNPEVVQHWKPITDAAFQGNVEAIEILVDHGADCNIVSGTGAKHTPLTRLCQYHKTIPKHPGHVATLESLLGHGADPAIAAGPLGLRPFEYACMGPIESLMNCFDDSACRMDAFALAAACDLTGLQECAKQQSLNVEDTRGRTPLHYVALSGMQHKEVSNAISCLELILDQGVEIDCVEPIPEGDVVFNATAIWYAVSWQQGYSVAEFLLQHGANPDVPAYSALFSQDQKLCELLDSHGADWNQTFAGFTPLMDVVRFNRPKSIEWLLQQNVDLTIKNRDGETALDLAIKRKIRPELIEAIRNIDA